MTKEANNKNILKAQFKLDFTELRDILNKHDIIGFMPSLPEDEYDCINHSLLSLLYKNSNIESIKELIKTEIKDHFGLNNNQDFVDKLAFDVYGWWNKRKNTP